MINIMKMFVITAITQINTEVPNNISNLEYKTPKGIPVILHNGSNYDYHFIIRYLPAEEFKGQFE